MSQELILSSSSGQKYITDYLRHAADLEYDRYSLEKLLEKLADSRAANKSAMECNKNAIENMKTRCSEPMRWFSVRELFADIFSFIFEIVGGIVAIDVIFFIIVAIDYYFLKIGVLNGLMDYAFSTSRPMLFLFVYVPFTIIAGYLLIAILCMIIIKCVKKIKEHVAARRQIKIMQEEICRERVRDAYLENEISRCTGQLNKLNRSREEFYRGDLIPEKYRDAVPMSMMFDYFATRICSTLEGHEGAFARFESEIRLDRIAATVGEINRKMDVVIRNQARILSKVEAIERHISDLATGIEQNGRKLDNLHVDMQNMTKNLDRIEDNTKLTKYYSEVTARCAQHEMWAKGYSNKMDP